MRVFVLVQPPFMQPDEAVLWAQRSVDFAFDCGATAVTLIPTRGGNGAMEVLSATQQFSPPGLKTLEASFIYGLELKRGRVFADLWDADKIPSCPTCRIPRIARLRHMNLSQINLAPARCQSCDPPN
jgi:archaeosine synthase beta-subunit